MRTSSLEVDERPVVSSAVTVVVAKVGKDGSVLFGRMEYTKKGRMSVRHPTETMEKHENVGLTSTACVLHEIARDASKFKYSLDIHQPIYVKLIEDQHDPNGRHAKLVYLLVDFEGELRDFAIPDGDEILGPITLVSATEYLKETKGNTVEFHYQASLAALTALAADRRVLDRFFGQISSWNPVILSDKDEELVQDFIRS